MAGGSPEKISALIPAGGYSSRMHEFKPLLPLGSGTVIERVVSLFRNMGVGEVIVVTGHNHDLLAPAAEGAGARIVFNPDYDGGMFSSIRAGAAALSKGCRGFFLLPADIPAIRPHTLKQILEAFVLNPKAVVVPAFMGQTGHPPLIPAAVIPEIIGAGPEGNLRAILFPNTGRGEPSAAGFSPTPLAVPDRGILMDADRPGDYERIVSRVARLDIPDADECRALMELEGLAPELRAHLELVAETAAKLVGALRSPSRDEGPRLDPDLVLAGALLHDIKRSEENHAAAGRDFLLGLGFSRVAGIAGAHMDLDGTGGELTERDIVFFSDKLCIGSSVDTAYEHRFAEKADRYPQARERIMDRLETARQIQSRIESAAGRSLREILG